MTNSGAWRGTGRSTACNTAVCKSTALINNAAVRIKRIQQSPSTLVYRSFRALDMVDRNPCNPHPEIAAVAASFDTGRRVGCDLEHLPLALQHAAVQVDKLLSGLFGIPG